MGVDKLPIRWHTCTECGKRGYESRAAAKASRRIHPNPKGMREYRCPSGNGDWHLGHLPPNVRKGKITAGEIYNRRREVS